MELRLGRESRSPVSTSLSEGSDRGWATVPSDSISSVEAGVTGAAASSSDCDDTVVAAKVSGVFRLTSSATLSKPASHRRGLQTFRRRSEFGPGYGPSSIARRCRA